jgi:hypothetical protein
MNSLIKACVGIALVVGLLVLIYKTMYGQISSPPSSIDIGANEFLIEGQPQVVSFSGSSAFNDVGQGQIVLRSDLSFMDWSNDCEYDAKVQRGIVCPSGFYTATVYPEFLINDIFTGFTLLDDDRVLYDRLFALVKNHGVTPYLVHIIDRTKDAANINVKLTNQGPKEFNGEVVVTVDPPGDNNDHVYDLKDVRIPVGGKITSDPLFFEFEGNGYYFVSVRIGEESFNPLGFDIFYQVEKTYLPTVTSQ